MPLSYTSLYKHVSGHAVAVRYVNAIYKQSQNLNLMLHSIALQK